jgi:FHA domain
VDRGPVRTGVPRPGTLVVLEPGGGPTVGPQEGRVLVFGRNRPDVHICVGPDDPGVSRRHGTLEFTAGRWWVRTLGSRPVRVGGTHVLRRGDEPVPLAEGRTSLLVEGADPRDLHLVRVRVVGVADRPPQAVQSGTVPVPCFKLDATERLVMTVLAQRQLFAQRNGHGPDPQPLTSREAAVELAALAPAAGWTQKKVEHLVKKVRDRLTGQGVDGLVPEPGRTGFDSAYRRNLIEVLLVSGTLGAADLRLLGLD